MGAENCLGRRIQIRSGGRGVIILVFITKLQKNKSSFYRLFRHILIVILCFLVTIGILIVNLSAAIYKKSRLNDIKAMGEMFVSCISDEYERNSAGYVEYAEELRLNIMCEYDVLIYMYNQNGSALLGRQWSDDDVKPLAIDMRDTLDSDDYLDIDKTSYLSKSEPYLIYGSKFYLQQENEKFLPSYILVYGGTDGLNRFTMNITLAYAAIILIAFVSCYLIIKRRFEKHIEFENNFLKISEKYSKGDFSEKLDTDLSENLKQITEHVNILAANVSKSEEKSSTFIANVSHELRTPITTIGGFVDGILDGTIKKSRQQEYLVLVSQEIQRLRILITSMLNMSRFESGTMSPNFHETNITDLVIKVVLMFEKRIEEKELEVEELDSSRLTAVVDADLMQQVIYNLVENAVKFVNKGGTLSFSFDRQDDICIIGIRNTGEGLKDCEIPQVFDRFYKTDSSRGKDTSGLGLGLAISRKIVHLHNGHIVVKSVYGEYTEFQIRIPVDPRTVNKDKKEKNNGRNG